MKKPQKQAWCPMDPDLAVDQRRGYDALREQQPFAKDESLGWTAMRYDDVVAITRDPESFSNATAWESIDPGLSKDQRAIPLALDPPEHTAYRKLLRDLFKPSRVAGYEAQARDKAARMIDAMVDAGTADVVANFSDPYPVQSLCAFLGWDGDNWADIKRWSRELTRARASGPQEEADALFAMWRNYIRDVLEQRKASPRDDVTSWLIEISEDGAVLNDEQIISILRLLLVAGHGTTTTAIGNMIEYLARDPGRQQPLRDDPDILPRAIEEMLRYDSPQLAMPRRTTCPVEIGGQQFDAGETIWLNFLAANRDPRMFEDADTCRFDRRPNRHIAFGFGIHACLGAPFGRMEVRVALEELFARTRSFRFDPDGEQSRLGFPHNQPKRLDIVFER